MLYDNRVRTIKKLDNCECACENAINDDVDDAKMQATYTNWDDSFHTNGGQWSIKRAKPKNATYSYSNRES